MSVKRIFRIFLRAWIGAGPLLLAPAVRAAEPFSLVVLPDTQYYLLGLRGGTPAMFQRQVDWIVSNRVARNIRFVLHEGDVTEYNSTSEWAAVSGLMGLLDSNQVPYALAVGNHDLGTNGEAETRDTLLNAYFPWSAATGKTYFAGAYETGKLENSCYHFSAGGVDWLVLVLEFGPRNAVLDWANQVVAQASNRQVIVLTHAHTYGDGTLQGSDPTHELLPRGYSLNQHSGYPNHGNEVWDKLIRKHSRISFVFSGHTLSTNGGARCVATGDYGNTVYQLLANYQDKPFGGGGFMRILYFAPGEGRVVVSTYSPFFGASKTDPDNAFTLQPVKVFDPSPPAPPPELQGAAESYRTIRVNWSNATDAESGIARYVVYRNGVFAGIVASSPFVLRGLSENTTNRITVRAVNGAGLWSDPSSEIVVVTPPDTKPPGIKTVQARGHTLSVLFSEPLWPADATNLSCYAVSAGVVVSQAWLSAEGTMVTLVASPMTGGQQYVLAVSGVQDRSRARNTAFGLSRRFVAQPCLLYDGFEDGNLDGWVVVDEGTIEAPSAWRVTNGVLRQSSNIYGPDVGAVSNRQGTFVYWSAPEAQTWSPYTFDVRIRTADDDGLGVIFHYQDPSNYCTLDLDRQRVMRKLFERVDGAETERAFEPIPYPAGTDLVLRVQVSNRTVLAELNGEQLFGGAVTTAVRSSGTVGLYCWGSMGVEFDDVFARPPENYTLENDGDTDGLPDDWETQILQVVPDGKYETIDDVRGEDDFDGDGLSNLHEWLAGTSPIDPSSVLACRLDRDDANQPILRWRSASNRSYDVLWTPSLPEGFYNKIEDLPATPPTNSMLLAAATCAFYRVRLRLPGGP